MWTSNRLKKTISYSANGELKLGFLLHVDSVSEFRKESETKHTSASALWLLISLSLFSSANQSSLHLSTFSTSNSSGSPHFSRTIYSDICCEADAPPWEGTIVGEILSGNSTRQCKVSHPAGRREGGVGVCYLPSMQELCTHSAYSSKAEFDRKCSWWPKKIILQS